VLIYVFRRLLLVIPILLGMTVISFAVGRAIPTDPVVAAIGDQAAMHPAIVSAYRARWGLDEPLPLQYLVYLRNLLHGDLGVSIYTHRPVLEDIRDYLPATIELATAAIIISVSISIPLGIIAATMQGGLIDFAVRMVSLIGVAMPIFFLALLSIDIFYVKLGIAPEPSRLSFLLSPPPRVTGLVIVDSVIAGDFSTFLDAIAHILLPASVLATWSIGLLVRITRTSMLSVMHQDFLRTARAKGARGFYVIRHHAFKNALIPVVTVVGLSYGDLLSGSILIETIFSWAGIGRYAYTAATHADFPAIIGVALVIAFAYTIVNLTVDIIHALLDPRVGSAMMAESQ
jgi:peptide/nickel transport system permease protein